jgi:hypothetical protein
MQWIALATEDELSEAVGIRLIREVGLPLEVGRLLRKGGFGYLHSRLQSFCQLAQHEPVLLITDLDRRPCAAHLIMEWLGRIPRPHRLLLRVAVREIEWGCFTQRYVKRHGRVREQGRACPPVRRRDGPAILRPDGRRRGCDHRLRGPHRRRVEALRSSPGTRRQRVPQVRRDRDGGFRDGGITAMARAEPFGAPPAAGGIRCRWLTTSARAIVPP